ncbi:hypothetical protein B0H11DRAFT_2030954 [Mycena galericulata]|nr:hypothetical protein B0H11DRAFT_2030954 [Mycena galericulata]
MGVTVLWPAMLVETMQGWERSYTRADRAPGRAAAAPGRAGACVGGGARRGGCRGSGTGRGGAVEEDAKDHYAATTTTGGAQVGATAR